jgi:NADH dehydrogenase
MNPNNSRVIIIGAGFGGLATAKTLAKYNFNITIIDKKNHHLFQPLLYQVATADLAPTDITWPIRSILSPYKNINVIMSEVEKIDLENQLIYVEHIQYPYDYLVVATGANNFYFGNESWEQYAPGLKNITDAIKIRKKILLAFEQAEITNDQAEKEKLLTFIIVGGGPTGVEMAGAIAELSHSILINDFRHINNINLKIILIEGGERLLPVFPTQQSHYTQQALQSLGVQIYTKELVQDITKDGVKLTNQYIPSSNIIWAAGIRVNSIEKLLPCEINSAGKAIVNKDLTLPNHHNVFVIGDAAKIPWYNNLDVPGIAPAAKQAGKYVAKVIAAKQQNKSYKNFIYNHAGNLATIGRHRAVVNFGRFRIKGWLAWYFWGLIHIYFLISARAATLVLCQWFWSYLSRKKGGRLIP